MLDLQDQTKLKCPDWGKGTFVLLKEKCTEMGERRRKQKHERAFYFQLSVKTGHCSHVDIAAVKGQYVDNCSLAGIVLKPDAGNTADAEY